MKPESIDDDPDNQEPLYSTRIVKIYLEYLKSRYPRINLDTILQKSGIQQHEIEDSAHWLTQAQVDRFNYHVVQETEDPNSSRAAGRFAAQSRHLGPLRQFALGLINPATAFMLMEKIHPMVSRGAVLKSNKLAANRVEVVTFPTAPAHEKIYQCENRMGFFEAVVMLFTNSSVTIRHDECYHKGHSNCRYLIEWDLPPSHTWKKLLRICLITSIPATAGILYFLSYPTSTALLLSGFLILLFFSIKRSSLEKEELVWIIKNQGKSAQNYLQEINRRYSDALLFQEIGKLTTAIRDTDQLAEAIAVLLEKHMEYSAGLILLTDEALDALVIKADFGIERADGPLTNKFFNLQANQPDLCFLEAIRQKKPVIGSPLSLRVNQDWLEKLGVRLPGLISSSVSIPIVYRDNPMGVLCFFNHDVQTPITESEINLLSGIASQLAIGITNAKSYQYLKESEEKYRALIEATNTGFVIINQSGDVHDANAEYVKLTPFQTLDEIIGKKVASWTADNDLTILEDAIHACQQDNQIKNFIVNYQNANGGLIPIEMSAAAVSIQNNRYVLSICRDITEQKRTQEIMIQTEKMSTVGTLAAGMAHELNNPLAAILQTLQVLKTRLRGRSADFNQTIEDHGLSIRDFERLHEELGTMVKIDAIIETGNYAADIVKNMVNFSQKDHAEYTRHNLAALLEKALEIAKSDYNLKNDYDFRAIEITREYDRDVPHVPCASAKIQQVFLTIFKNGAHEMFRAGKNAFKPKFILRMLAENEYVRVEIEDNGPGMNEEVLSRIFEPFYSTKEVGAGTGLGLSLAYFIVKDNHKGDLAVETSPGKGTRFIIRLPIYP